MKLRPCLSMLLAGTVFTMSGCAVWKTDNLASTQQQSPRQLNVVDITDVDSTEYANQNAGLAEQTDNFGAANGLPLYSSLQGGYKGRPLTKHIGDYVQNMAQDLVSNMDYVTQETPIGVTHFALIDSDLQHTNLLGKQMAESFIHEMHKFSIPVIDFKTTDYIRVTDNGDFVHSRDYLELQNSTGVQYVLSGTMAKHQGGYMVNARIIGMRSRAVVATAQTLVPFYVVDAIMPSHEGGMEKWVDGVPLSKGAM